MTEDQPHEIPNPGQVGAELYDRRNVVAIDASLTGTAIAAGIGREPHRSRFVSKNQGDTPSARLSRYEAIVSHCGDFCKMHAGDEPLIIIEGYSFGSKGRSVVNIGELGALLRQRLLDFADDVIEVPPKSIKKFTTNNGNADKRAMAIGAYKRWGCEFPTDDEVDAYALYQMGRAALDGGDLPEFQLECLGKAGLL